MKRALSILICLMALDGVMAQPLSNLVFTVGTTIQDASQKNWSYVLLGAPQSQLLAGKRFAVYGKNGLPSAAGSFTLRGTIFQQSNTSAISNLLNQGLSLNDDLASLSSALSVLFPAGGSPSLVQQVLNALQSGANDPSVAPELTMLARLHPGLNLCSGQGFAEVITTVTTYEVREINPGTGTAAEVVGRVTITPGAPLVLPAPGFPFQVMSNAPSDHLRIRLRWGTPDPLRRLSLLQFGFNVWRIPLAAAQAAGYDLTPPTTALLYSDTNFTRINSFPIMATTDYAALAGPGGPDDPTDLSTYFIADRNGRSPGNAQFPPGMTPPGYSAAPFNDGAQFYYFVTARDVLARDGLVSPGGLAMACRKMPPPAPTKLNVLNTTQGGQPFLLARWLPDINTNDLVNQYWVYRWLNPTMALSNEAMPSNFVAGVVAQTGQSNLAVFLDTNVSTPGPGNYWYTVRAVSQNACGQLLFSPNSAPASGVLRQRAAPAATTGELVGSCGSAVTAFEQFNLLDDSADPDTNSVHYRVTATRRDSGIAWVQFTVGDTNSSATPQTFGPLYFPPDGDSLSVDIPFSVNNTLNEVDVQCQAGTYYGSVSPPAACQSLSPPAVGQIKEAVFQTGELLFTALSSADPFLQAIDGSAPVFLTPASANRDQSGTLHLTFPGAAGQPLLIQFSTNNGAAWSDLGGATSDTNGIYSIYLCPCVISALPTLRGSVVNLPGEGNCAIHVARAGNTGPIAPIHIRFYLTPGTHEYRVYRSVDGAAPTMIAQAAALFDPSNPELVVTDDTMPPSAARLCYFVQLLDENGNGSPLALIGCKDVLPPKPPRPTLSQPSPLGNTASPQVGLSWFCPTTGVYRFEVRIHQDPATTNNTLLSRFSSVLLLTLTNPAPASRFYGLLRDRAITAQFEDWRVTPPVGPGFGPGPQFSLTAAVVPNATYHISVAAEDSHGNFGDASSEWTFIWKPPPTNLTVPWPARPLPPVTQFDDASAEPYPDPASYSPRVEAVLLNYYDQKQILRPDPNYPVGIRFAEIGGSYLFGNINSTNFASFYPPTDPNNAVFKRYSLTPDQNGQPLLPIVVYRQQVTNANFARVSGNLTQVTPLIEKIPWFKASNSFGYIPDRLIALNEEVWNDRGYNFLYLRDQQPVIVGAKYQYYVVRLNGQREVSEVIDAGTVEIPYIP